MRRVAISLALGSSLFLNACSAHSPAPLPPGAPSDSQTVSGAQFPANATETVLHSFGAPGDGAGPSSGVIADAKGDLFGTTIFGGATGNGTIFEMKPKGDGTYTESVLYSFTGGPDGGRPVAGLAMDSHGALYTNALSGANAGCFGGCGTVVKLTPGAKGYTETTLYSFNPAPDASQPIGTPVVDSAGTVYGATQFGGTSNNGAVYKLVPGKSGYTESVIYSLPGGSGGTGPQSGVALDAHGNIFGDAASGGDINFPCEGQCGVVFKLTRAGGTYTPQTIVEFHGRDGGEPIAAVTVDNATGTVYGPTILPGFGLIFSATTDSHGHYSETVVHTITGQQTGAPGSPLLLTPNGTLYGTMRLGGGGCSGIGCGQVFKLGRNGNKFFWSVIFGFRNALNGADPENTSLIQDAQGALYGTMRSGGTETTCYDGGPGGALGCGVVFKLTNF